MLAKTISSDTKTFIIESRKLLWAFFAIGPLGNILIPGVFPGYFRTYHVFLPFFPFFYTALNRRQLYLILLFLPFFFYSLISMIPVQIYNTSRLPVPLFRYFLLLAQFLFVVGAARHFKDEKDVESFIIIYLKAFFVSLLVGYVLFIGFYLKFFTFQFISQFCILAQFGYGFLRFSPGSYPNEYGIVSSFVLSILTLLFFRGETFFSKKFFWIFFTLTFGALLLATTRAAYLAYFFSLFYIAYLSGHLLGLVKWIAPISIAIFSILKFLGIDMFQIMKMGFSSEHLLGGSVSMRTSYWIESWQYFLQNPLFGKGFSSVADLHNVYLQFLIELGVVGTLLFIGTLLVAILSNISSTFSFKKNKSLVASIQTIGLFHVLSFAVSNHNLNHHLTWLILLLYIWRAVRVKP